MKSLRIALLGSLCAMPVRLSSQTADLFNPDPNGWVFTSVEQLCGGILVGGPFTQVGGESRNFLGRFHSDASFDGSFQHDLRVGTPSGQVECVGLQPDGSIIVGGRFAVLGDKNRFNIARLNADGSTDTNFYAGAVDGDVRCIAVQPDDKLLVVGAFSTFGGQARKGICRVNADGSLDTNFNAGANGFAYTCALQPDGKVIVMGLFSQLGGHACEHIGRLNGDGSRDTNFQASANSSFGTLLVQPDGKLLVGGNFTSLCGGWRTNIGRLNVDGTLDDTFNASTTRDGAWGVQSLALQTDGKILIGGDFKSVNGVLRNGLARLNSDGTLDPGFDADLVSTSLVLSLSLQTDGKILIGGMFASLGGEMRKNAGRLVNTDPATQELSVRGSTITWLRGGTSPEVWRTTFDCSTDGTNWSRLGDGGWINGGWSLADASIPPNAVVRARGFVTGGEFNGSYWIVETEHSSMRPLILVGDGLFGIRSNRFQFNIAVGAGATVIVERSANLLNWIPVATNVSASSPVFFCDQDFPNHEQSAYRVRVP